ncbi:MAG: serine hydrolase [Bacteroidia bacterium]|nr:serine hydrolase [Bacteroidia bacterium]
MKSKSVLMKLQWIVVLSLLAIACSKEPLPDSLSDSLPNPLPNPLPPMINTRSLEEAFTDARQIANLRSLVVVQNGQLIKEGFYGTGGADVPQDVRSVTKTITSLLIGIAIDKGYLTSVDQRIGEFLDPQVYSYSTEKASIKIRDLLTMSSGFEWDELTSVTGYNDWISAANQVQYVLDKPLVSQPGIRFTYNSGACHLLSVILTKATGMTTENFAWLNLFQPLGIQRRSWQVDKQGFNNGGAGLSLSPYDMVKIGTLILTRGEFQKKNIVSPKYIRKAILSQISTNNSQSFGSGYGYCLWTGGIENHSYAFANGFGGQFIVVVPDLNLVVVATNQWSGVASTIANEQWYRTLDIIITRIITSFQSVDAAPFEDDNT